MKAVPLFSVGGGDGRIEGTDPPGGHHMFLPNSSPPPKKSQHEIEKILVHREGKARRPGHPTPLDLTMDFPVAFPSIDLTSCERIHLFISISQFCCHNNNLIFIDTS